MKLKRPGAHQRYTRLWMSCVLLLLYTHTHCTLLTLENAAAERERIVHWVVKGVTRYSITGVYLLHRRVARRDGGTFGRR